MQPQRTVGTGGGGPPICPNCRCPLSNPSPRLRRQQNNHFYGTTAVDYNLDDGEPESIVMALGQQWHCDCFRCSVCDNHLHNWYFEREGLLYCRDDYYARFGDACQQCTAVITGPVMVAGEHKFHPECFCCNACGSFIGEGESYALVERSKLYCGHCYGKRNGSGSTSASSYSGANSCEPDARARITKAGKPMHSIRLVEIPKDATPGLRVDGGIPLDDGCPTVRITEIDVNLTNLHIGDRILEVNGQPVSDSSVEQIDKLIRSNEKMLQLTVEHDPVEVCRSCSQADIQRACSASTLALPLSTSASSVEVGRERRNLYKIAADPPNTKSRKLRQATSSNMSTATNTSTTLSTIISNCTSTSLKEKERCSSLSKLLDDQHTAQQHSAHPQLYDLSRTQSCRVVQKPQRIFRATDLVMGEKLGEGFFGKVYKVTHRLSGEIMVLKELHRADEEAQRNFIKEVAVLRLLDHRHVLKFIGVLYKDKKLHMVTEYVAGGCLKELIHDSRQTLNWSQRVCLARDIACGMSYLHSMNIIHRDLNSMNCLVREDRSVIVADFGLARSVDAPPRLPGANTIGDASAVWSPNGTLKRSKSRQRRQRYTVVGNPYWMAPEMMKGLKYDEKVDVFSFGIMLCEIIGRVEADPDYMPRNSDFSLNQQEFREKFCSHCPEEFVKVAFVCCDLNPDMRPCFDTLYIWLEQLHQHLDGAAAPASELLQEIENFQESSSYVSSEDALSPTSHRSLDNLCDAGEPHVKSPPSPSSPSPPPMLLNEEKENVILRPQDIPKSPHLGKDFSPTGERLRDSMRARRRQRFLGAQQQQQQQQHRGFTPETTSTERALKQALRKCRPFGEKGYLVDLRPGEDLQLQDVRDLNNYSDVDSSCDTSLNYHDINQTGKQQTEAEQSQEIKVESTPPSTTRPVPSALRHFFKTPPVALKMFQRLEHEASLNGGSAAPRAQRINQTPIFGRRHLPFKTATMTPPPIPSRPSYRLNQSESLEHLVGVANQTMSASKRSKATLATTSKPPVQSTPTPATTLICHAEMHRPTITAPSPANPSTDWLAKKHKLTLPLAVAAPSTGRAPVTKPLRTSSSNTGNNSISPTRHIRPTNSRPGSPSKHLAQRHTAATAQRLNMVAANSNTTRINILSPEKVHRLGARLSDQKQKLREAAETASSAAINSSSNGHGQRSTATVGSSSINMDRRRRIPPPPPMRAINR